MSFSTNNPWQRPQIGQGEIPESIEYGPTQSVDYRGNISIKDVEFNPQMGHVSLTEEVGSHSPVSYSSVVIEKAVHKEYIYGILGLVLGFSSIIGGIILGLHGLAGTSS